MKPKHATKLNAWKWWWRLSLRAHSGQKYYGLFYFGS